MPRKELPGGDAQSQCSTSSLGSETTPEAIRKTATHLPRDSCVWTWVLHVWTRGPQTLQLGCDEWQLVFTRWAAGGGVRVRLLES